MTSTDAGRLRQFLAGLPQTDRYVLLLSYADGLSAAEIGLVLDLPEFHVNHRLAALKARASAAVRPTTPALVEPSQSFSNASALA